MGERCSSYGVLENRQCIPDGEKKGPPGCSSSQRKWRCFSWGLRSIWSSPLATTPAGPPAACIWFITSSAERLLVHSLTSLSSSSSFSFLASRVANLGLLASDGLPITLHRLSPPSSGQKR